jgi:uncharacterized protein (DUF305 family)
MDAHAMPGHPYRRLMIMAFSAFLSMYVLMYAMVDEIQNVFPNLNQLYMAGLMTAPMIIFELALMGSMYPDKRRNTGLIVASAVAGILFFAGIRTQAFVTDAQFMKSMIPHHAGAILMCERAPLQDQKIRSLCETILDSQRTEIDWMQEKLEEQ